MGFGAQIKVSKAERTQKLFQQVVPHDLVRFGLIPELVGRIPVIATLEPLDEDALVSILTEPKNSMVRQYKKLFELDGISVEFTVDALREVAKKAIERKTGARGLRAIMEDILGPIMYESPSDPTIEKIVITEECVKDGAAPEITHNPLKKPVKLRLNQPASRQRRGSVS